MKQVLVADLYGLGGYQTSPGMLTLAQKIRALGPNFIVTGPYNESQWPAALAVLKAQAPDWVLAAVGYSLGANNIVQIAAGLGVRRMDYLAGIQASYWGAGVFWSGNILLPANVRVARTIYNPSFVSTGGLGYARYIDYFPSIKLISTPTTDLHPDVDNDAGLHSLILKDLKGLAQ